jgi:hypothetical protein
MDRVLTIFIKLWIGLVALTNVAAIVGLMAGATSFWAGVGRVQEMYSPFTLSTFLINVVLSSPAIGAYAWRERRRARASGQKARER